jgi:hypothetical protein
MTSNLQVERACYADKSSHFFEVFTPVNNIDKHAIADLISIVTPPHFSMLHH